MKTNNNNIPAYRFQGYTDAWELRKLVNEVLFIGTGKSKFSALEFGEFEILGSTSVIGYDNSYDYEGDFILTARVGANAGELYRHSGKVKISDNTVFIQGDVLDFIFYILQHFDIKKLSFGTGQPLVKASELKELKILMPVSIKERNHVGTFFSTLDRHITLHQRKLDTLKEQKKTYLKLLFPAKGQTKPALRFQGFEDDWEEVKLGEVILKEIKGKAKSEMLGSAEVYLETEYLNGGTKSFVDCEKDVEEDDILILWDGSQAGMVYHGFSGALGSTLKAYRPKESGKFIYYQLVSQQNLIFEKYRTPNIPHVIKTFTDEFRIFYSSLPEQEVIGTFFQTIDQEIAQVEDKLASLKEMKKTLLRKLFA